MKKVLTTALFGALAVTSAACDAGLGLDGNAKASMSFAAVGSPTLLGGQTPPDSVIRIGGHAIALTSADLRLSKIEISGDENEMEMKGGQTIVALPVNGTLTTPISATLAAGTYDQLEMKIESVRIRGTYDGKPFDVTVDVVSDLETAISPPLVVTESGSTNFTVVVNIADWFRSRTGQAIDPSDLNAVSTAELHNNIKASFKAFDDDNRNGEHDDGDDDDHDADDDDGDDD